MQISTIVYGDYIGMFEEVCLKSLFQSENIPWLQKKGYDIEYVIYTRDGRDIEKLKEVIKKFDCKFIIRGFSDSDELINTTLIKEIIKYGIEKDVPTLFINPDLFVANGSLKNMVSYKYKGNMCIASVHVRVDKDKFKEAIKDKNNIGNAELVDIAMETLHPSWADSFIDKDKNASFITCSMVQKISDNLWSVIMRIPTVYYVKFQQSDLDLFSVIDNESRGVNYGMWDHTWPEHLVNQNRFKFTGSSDFFFAVELTHKDDNLPGSVGGKMLNDECHNSKKHSEINRNFVTILRGNE